MSPIHRSRDDAQPYGVTMKMIQRTVAAATAVALAALVGASCRDREETPPQRAGATPYAGPAVRLPDEGYRVEWVSNTVPATMKAGTTREVDVTFKNGSGTTWPDPGSTGSDPSVYGAVRLAYRWHSLAPPIYAGEASRRADLARPLRPGETTT